MKNKRVGRPTHCRCVQDLPKVTCFKPDGVPDKELKTVLLTVDELEAIRLADKEGLYQADAAVQMNVSRPTFGRILEAAHRKVAEAIVDGKQLCIQGGVIRSLCDSVPTERPDICICPECGMELPHLKGEPCRETSCPQCGASLKRKGGCMSELQP
ncbi:MAG: DUF134 domain-containing protein [Chlorobiaceae bacterium]|nr:DUF134 domain-containing protein [Chlorobiaceae bacterium]